MQKLWYCLGTKCVVHVSVLNLSGLQVLASTCVFVCIYILQINFSSLSDISECAKHVCC